MSPNQQEVVFSSDVTGAPSLWVVNTQGQALRRLTYGPSDDEPKWSPDGLTVVFTRRLNNVKDIWKVQRDGSGLQQITSKSLNNFQPTWSPDGTRVAFTSDRAGTNDIWMMNVDGSNPVRVTSLSGEESEPVFSPSGAEIAFSETANNSSSIFAVTLSTGATRRITGTGFNDWHPSWAPAGILFASDRLPKTVSGNKTIWITQGDGTGLRQYAPVMALDPSWTAGGNVVFTDEANPGVASASIALLQQGSTSATSLIPPTFSGDLNGDGIIDIKDLAIVQAALNKAANQPYDARDRNNDGKIDALDVRLLTTQCRYDRCASTAP
jgi:Tol biopolymer transport system component